MNTLFSFRVTKADVEGMDPSSKKNRSEWIRESIEDLLNAKSPRDLVRDFGGKFGEHFTEFLPVTLPLDIAAKIEKLAAQADVTRSQIVRAAVRRRIHEKADKPNARRR